MTAPNDGSGLPTLGPIQVVPPGLMGLLQLKQLGKLPGELSQLVEFTIEARDWYFEARRSNEVGLFGSQPVTAALVTGNIGAQFFAPNAIVPPNQIWYVEQLSIFGASGAAADTIAFTPAINPAFPGTELLAVGPLFLDTVTARQRNWIAKSDRGFWMPAGYAVCMVVQDIASAGTGTFKLSMRATVLPL